MVNTNDMNEIRRAKRMAENARNAAASQRNRRPGAGSAGLNTGHGTLNTGMSRGTFMKGLGLAGAGVAAAGLGLSGAARAINWGPGPTYVDDPNRNPDSPNNYKYPQVCAIMYNFFYWNTSNPWGWLIDFSGILIGPKTILTCAHGPVLLGANLNWEKLKTRLRVSFGVYPDAIHNPQFTGCPSKCVQCDEYVPWFCGDLYSIQIYPSPNWYLSGTPFVKDENGCIYASGGDGENGYISGKTYRQAYNDETLKVPNPDTDYYSIKQIYIHPQFHMNINAAYNPQYDNVPYDIAIIELEEPVTGIAFPKLPTCANFIDTERANGDIDSAKNQFSAAGYGANAIDKSHNYDDARKYAEDIASFTTIDPAFLRLSAHSKQGQTSTCSGDSGGPWFYRANTTKPDGTPIPITDPMTQLTLVGVTTGGGPSCNLYEWVSRIDTPEVLNWIKHVKECIETGGETCSFYDDTDKIIKGINGNTMYGIVSTLSNDYYKGRRAGSEKNELVANDIAQEFSGYGLTTSFQNFDMIYLTPDADACSFQVTNMNGVALDLTAKIGHPNPIIGQDYLVNYKSDCCDNLSAEVVPWDNRSPVLMQGKILMPLGNDPPGDPMLSHVCEIDLGKEAKKLGAMGVCGMSGSTLSAPCSSTSYQDGLIIFKVTQNLADVLLYGFNGKTVKAKISINTKLPDGNGTDKVLGDPMDKLYKTVRNVIGILPAAENLSPGYPNPYKDEIIIVCAHFDGQGSQAGLVFPSANDNASSVAVMMEIARALASTATTTVNGAWTPLRNIYFIAFNGEEEGFLGSKAYVDQLTDTELNNIAAVFNMEMMGRGGVCGWGQMNNLTFYTNFNCTGIMDLVESRAAMLPFGNVYATICPYDPSPSLSRNCVPSGLPIQTIYNLNVPVAGMGSDQYPFAAATNASVLYVGASGWSCNYHKTTDVVSNLKPVTMELGAKIIAATVLELAKTNGPLRGRA